MPSLENWIDDPLGTIQSIYDTYHGSGSWETEVDNFFSSKLGQTDVLSKIPSLNEMALSELRPGQLVRFRGMVQDQLGTEFYCSEFVLRNSVAGSERNVCGKYRDEFTWKQDEEIVNKDSTADRQCYYCVPIPGETAWVKKVHKDNHSHARADSALNQKSQKRSHQDEEDEMECEVLATASSEQNKRVCVNMETETTAVASSCNREKLLNFPLPSPDDIGCIVKVYKDDSFLAMNEVLEVVAILSMESPITLQQSEDLSVFSPPPSLIPRLHCVQVNMWQHNNPRLPQRNFHSVLTDMSLLRDRIHGIFTDAFGGDSLAAEYFLCHLISSVYIRKDVMAIGKFSLNLTNFTQTAGNALYSLVEQLVTKAHYLPLTLDNMNKSKLIPTKDYTENRLVSGILQLSPHTHLVLDETAMSPGQLQAQGVRNVAALGNVITWQRVSYDFNFHESEFPTNLVVLVVSERKSLLPSDAQVPLQATADPQKLEEISRSLQGDSLTEHIRNYLTVVRLLDYQLTPEIQNVIQEDFVRNRQASGTQKMTTEDLHLLLVLARLLALTHGQTSLTVSLWEKAKLMEAERKARIHCIQERH